MYENYTYEYILKSILDRIAEYDPSIDIREGSAMWYAVAPVASELAVAYVNCDAVSKESFVGTATREGMYRACEDIGIDTTQFEASAGIFHAHFDTDVSIGSRWACDDYIFVVTSRDGSVVIDDVEYPQYRLTCETLGTQTQYTSGNLRAITYYGSNTVRVAVLDSCIIVGGDETPDEKVRETYFHYISNKSEDGNIAQYKAWLSEFEGVGAYKIAPRYYGDNTVRVVILDENKESPTQELIASVQDYLDPNEEGLGEGKAPIGAIVTVEGGVNVEIDVQADVTLSSPDADTQDVNENITNYFRKIAFEKSAINIYEVASIILSSPSIVDVSNVRMARLDSSEVNYVTSNLMLAEYETPVLSAFNSN